MYIRTRTRRRIQSSKAKRLLFAAVAVCLVVLMPGPYALADGTPSSPSDTTTAQCAPVKPTTGTDKPTGAWAPTFSYNSCTGLYENKYYTWSPATHAATYIYPMVYSCDTALWQWTAKQYTFVASHNDYEPIDVYAAQLPTGAQVAAGSPATCTPPPPPVLQPVDSQNQTNAPQSAVQSNGTNAVSATVSNAAGLTNYIGSVALSGNALVTDNTTGGDATSGNVSAMANVLNSIQSSTSLAGATTFVANINGTVQGDVMIDPSLIQPAAGSGALDSTNNINVNAKNSGQINNTIDLSAASGNAGVANNTTAGNASSGNASAIADVMNMINSMIGANQSFVGVININGNLQGNILVPQHFLDSLIASNAPATTMTVPTSSLNSVNETASTTNAIMNNVTSSAVSGQSAVNGNTTAGNAVTGSATTNVTIFNLTGSNVVGTNALLVFVNVLGKWIGVIMDAPAGTTAAALGAGISSSSTNTLNTDAVTNNQIANSILVSAKTGDAAVTGNTTAGNATTGNAATAVNLLNVSNTNYSLSSWFGILFINVFGSWYGNFGAFTPAASGGTPSVPTATMSGTPPPTKPNVFQFRPVYASISTADASMSNAPLPLDPASVKLVSAEEAKVLASVVGKQPITAAATKAQDGGQSHDVQILGAALTLVGIVLIVGERITARLRSRG